MVTIQAAAPRQPTHQPFTNNRGPLLKHDNIVNIHKTGQSVSEMCATCSSQYGHQQMMSFSHVWATSVCVWGQFMEMCTTSVCVCEQFMEMCTTSVCVWGQFIEMCTTSICVWEQFIGTYVYYLSLCMGTVH